MTIGGVRCRLNVLRSMRGVGAALRLLYSRQLTVEKLNLHPTIADLADLKHGMVLVSGPTGSGKSSTLAALINEINLAAVRHIVTIESPIEYLIKPQRSIIRQREVGRDTPSFAQGLLDSLREDPDVLMVGEMRDPETMRLTLNAAETGRVVYATVHSGSCSEALQRIIGSFAAGEQDAVAMQLADCVEAVICQSLHYSAPHELRLPVCEILRSTSAIRACIRNREFFKIASFIETGAEYGMWTSRRYQAWADGKLSWVRDDRLPVAAEDEPRREPAPATERAEIRLTEKTAPPATKEGVIEIEPFEGNLGEILKKR